MKHTKLLYSLAAICLAFLLFPQTANAAGFVQGDTGVKFQNDDGTFIVNSWLQIGENLYHFDVNGNAQTGWIQVDGLWYLLDANGVCTGPGVAEIPANGAEPATAPTAPAAQSDASKAFSDAGWVPFQTTDTNLLSAGISAGLVGTDGTQYWAEPTFAAAVAQASLQPATDTDSAPAYVWLSATGSKYHRINNCGNMNPNRATKVSLEEAQRRGKTRCSKCF